MTAFAPTWDSTDPKMTAQNLMATYTLPSSGLQVYGQAPSGMIVEGADPSLGYGEFIYAQVSNATGVNAGDVCELTHTLLSSGSSVAFVNSVQQWAGGANSGKPLCVALAALAQNQFGWFQVYGPALINTSAAVAVNASAYWNALGVVQSAGVASKQMLQAQCVVASSASFGQGVLGVTPAISATQGIYFINYPFAQGAIT
jgi:hypothetical protein